MSKDRHLFGLAIVDGRNPGLWEDIQRKPPYSEYDGYLTSSSSPPRSSSPPSTPYSSRRDLGYAYIHSSPDVPVNSLYRKHVVDDLGRPALSSKLFFSSPYSIYDHRLASGHGFQKNACRHRQYVDSDGHGNDFPSDSEDEMEDISGISSEGNGYRTTFRISAERGLWRTDPMPLIKVIPSTLQERKSVPTFSRVSTPLPLTVRTVSEPAPSNVSQMTGFHPEIENEHIAELSDTVADTGLPGFIPLKPDHEISWQHTVPSIVDTEDNDEDVNIELEASGVPSSPLPPSSPPLSPLSRSISIISRSSSPLSFAFERSSSPLSELPDDYDNEESDVEDEEDFAVNNALGMRITEQTSTLPLKMEAGAKDPENPSELQTSCRDLAQKERDLSPSKPQLTPRPCSVDPLTFSPAPVSSIPATLPWEDVVPVDSDDPSSSTFGPTVMTSPKSLRLNTGLDGSDVEMTSNLVVLSPTTSTEKLDDLNNRWQPRNLKTSSALKDRNGVVHRSSSSVQPSSSRVSLQKASASGKKEQGEGRTEKQCGVRVKPSDVPGKKRSDRDDEEDVENDGSSSVAGSRRKRLKRMDGDTAAPRSTKYIPNARRRTRPASTYDEGELDGPLDDEARALHATICGLVIETMATSRASSLPVSSLFKLVMSSQPYLKSQRSETDWLRIFQRVLRDGAADRGTGVFGKVESSGKDESNRALEAQWFYVPERDEDQERAALIRSMMPRPGKRTETMKYKQYYWRPLGKTSKWDSEDAL